MLWFSVFIFLGLGDNQRKLQVKMFTYTFYKVVHFKRPLFF